jgi:acetyl esterase/lipase
MADLHRVRRWRTMGLAIAMMLSLPSGAWASPGSNGESRTGEPPNAAAATQAVNIKLVDPELLPLLRMMPRGDVERTAETMPAVREGFRQFFEASRALKGPGPTGVTVREINIPGVAGAPPVRALVYEPEGEVKGRSAMLDIHGGSWILGFPEMNDFRNRNLSHDLGLLIVSIDYRLAPEHPYPAAIDDAHAALVWMNTNADKLGINPARIAVSGNSAGGAIAGGLVLRTRDEGKYLPAFQVLIYPALGDRQPLSGPLPFAVKSYLGKLAEEGADVPAYAFPAKADTLAGSPPTFIAVGALDYLNKQNVEFARRLIENEVPTELHVYPGAFHGFDAQTTAHVSRRFYDDLRTAIGRALNK